jgi:hypothetical protein
LEWFFCLLCLFRTCNTHECVIFFLVNTCISSFALVIRTFQKWGSLLSLRVCDREKKKKYQRENESDRKVLLQLKMFLFSNLWYEFVQICVWLNKVSHWTQKKGVLWLDQVHYRLFLLLTLIVNLSNNKAEELENNIIQMWMHKQLM